MNGTSDVTINSTCSVMNGSASDESDSPICSLSESERLITYAVLIASSVGLNLLRGGLLYMVCNNASRVLHNRMFAAILRTPILFFDTNPSGMD